MFDSISVAVLTFFLVSSSEGFSGVLPLARPVAVHHQRLFASSTLDSQIAALEASFLNGSLDDKAIKFDSSNMIPEQELLGHAQEGEDASGSNSPSPVYLESNQPPRKTKISASVKETGYDSVNNYMVSCELSVA